MMRVAMLGAWRVARLHLLHAGAEPLQAHAAEAVPPVGNGRCQALAH